MEIVRSALLPGAQAARGVAIVIDVFRACSLVAYALSWGARRVIPVAAIETALDLKRRNRDWLSLGERYGRALPGFDGGNSPALLREHALAGRTIVHTTHAGSQGLTAASGAAVVLTGAFVNAAATVRHARRLVEAGVAPVVSVVAMGGGGVEPSAEDELCAEGLCAALRGQAFDWRAVRETLRAAPAAQKFFDPAADWAPAADFELCSAVDAIDFAIELRTDDDGLSALLPARMTAA